MYLNSFPETPVNAYINNSFSQYMDIHFTFSTNKLSIKCATLDSNTGDYISTNTWFFVKCAISFDHEDQFFLYIKNLNDGKEYKNSRRGIGESEYNKCKHFLKKYYEPDDFISLHFYNFNKVKNNFFYCNIFMKQFVMLREFLPEPYDNKYYHMEKLLTSTLEMPEILFIIPFDELKREGNKYKIKCYSYDENIEQNEIILSPKESGEKFSLYPPKLFKRLNLLDKNQYYSSPDLLKTTDMTPSDNVEIFSPDGNPLSCKDEYFLYYTPANYSGVCQPNCEYGSDKYTMIFGLGDRKGFCNRKCTTSDKFNCLSTQTDLLSLKTKFKCQNENNYYNIFYQCEEKNLEEQKKNIFYYDPNYSPYNIIMDVRHYDLKSYIIEFWYHYNECDKITRGYIFYTNQIQIQNIELSFNVYTTAHDFIATVTISKELWNHIVLEVFYDPREVRNHKTKVFIQTSLNSNSEPIDYSENPYPLEYIYFCNGRRSSCNNIELNWFCGYYKNLRLFNGILAQRHVVFRYDELYHDYQYLLSSVLLYYPLFGDYISNNILGQYENKLSSLITTSDTNNWIFPQYNYCLKPDIDFSPNNCVHKFNEVQCYKCKDNYFLYRKRGGEEIICESNAGHYVLKLPTSPDFVINILQGRDKYEGYTINFFIKVYGFTTKEKIDIIYLGEHLKLSYNSIFDDPYFGLNLVSYTGTSENVISNYYHFRKHFGLWTFISVATYNKTNDAFFPPLVRFEINQKKMPIVGPLDNLNFDDISFSKEVFALVRNLRLYSTYIIGAHSYEINTNSFSGLKNEIVDTDKISPIYFQPVNSIGSCTFSNNGISSSQTEYDCVPDDDEQLFHFYITKISNFKPFLNEYRVGGEDECKKTYCELCIGKSEFNCSCNFKNDNSMIFLGDISDHYCKRLEYVNFARAQDTTVPVKKGGTKFTLHFWVFAYSYIDKVFEGLSIEWKDHVTVEVYLDSTKNIIFIVL
jgi:hypothetical protein